MRNKSRGPLKTLWIAAKVGVLAAGLGSAATLAEKSPFETALSEGEWVTGERATLTRLAHNIYDARLAISKMHGSEDIRASAILRSIVLNTSGIVHYTFGRSADKERAESSLSDTLYELIKGMSQEDVKTECEKARSIITDALKSNADQKIKANLLAAISDLDKIVARLSQPIPKNTPGPTSEARPASSTELPKAYAETSVLPQWSYLQQHPGEILLPLDDFLNGPQSAATKEDVSTVIHFLVNQQQHLSEVLNTITKKGDNQQEHPAYKSLELILEVLEERRLKFKEKNLHEEGIGNKKLGNFSDPKERSDLLVWLHATNSPWFRPGVGLAYGNSISSYVSRMPEVIQSLPALLDLTKPPPEIIRSIERTLQAWKASMQRTIVLK